MRKILRLLVLILGVVIIGYVGVSLFANYKIKRFLEDEIKTGDLQYADFDLELWSGNFEMDSLVYSFKQGCVSADGIALKHMSYWAYVFGGDISVSSLQIDNPDVKLHLTSGVDYKGHKKKAQLELNRTVEIDSFSFYNGDFTLQKDSLKTLDITDYTLFFKGLKATPKSIKGQIPFLFDNVKMKGGRLMYRPDITKTVRADSLNFDDQNTVVQGITIQSNTSLNQYISDSTQQKDWVDIDLNRLEVKDYTFSLTKKINQLTSSSVLFDGLCATLYQKKGRVKDSLNEKSSRGSFLEALPLKVDVDTIAVAHLGLDYHQLLKQKGSKHLIDQSVLQLDHYGATVSGISLGDSTASPKKRPLSYKNFMVKGGEARYRLNPQEILRADSIAVGQSTMTVFAPKVRPTMTKTQFAKHDGSDRDWLKGRSKRLIIFDYRFDVQKDSLALKGARLSLDDIDLSVYTDQRSSKEKTQAPQKHPKTNLPFILKFDTVALNQINLDAEALTTRKTHQTLLSLNDYQLELIDFKAHPLDTMASAPFAMKEFSVRGKSLHYHLNTLQDLKIDSLHIGQHNARIYHFQLVPNYNRWNYVRVIPYEKDLMDIDIKRLHFADFNLDIGTHGKLSSSSVTLDTVDMNVFRDKRVRDDPTAKKLYSGMLRTMNLKLNIDTLKINKADLAYEELQENTGKTGKVFFKNMTVQATNITNLNLKRTDFPTTKVDISSRFMGRSPLHVGWSFKINDRLDRFRIHGNGHHIPPVAINSFLTPAFNIRAKGKGIDYLNFDFHGNHNLASGNFKMVYQHLKIDVLKNGTGERRGFLSFVGNLVMHKKRTKDRDAVQVQKVRRDPTKSFWNYLWKCVFSGLRGTVVF